jgi:membrane protein
MKNQNNRCVKWWYVVFYISLVIWGALTLFFQNKFLSIPIKIFPLSMIDWGVTLIFIILFIISIIEKHEKEKQTLFQKTRQEVQYIKEALKVACKATPFLFLLFVYLCIDIPHFFNSENLKEITKNSDFIKWIYFIRLIVVLFEQFYLYILLELGFNRKIKNSIPAMMIIVEFYILFNGFFFYLINRNYYIDTEYECKILYSKVLSYSIVMKLLSAIVFYFIKNKMWSGKQNFINEILKTEGNLIITEKPETWNNLEISFKKLKKKMYKNLKFKFLEYESCLLESNGENFNESEILLSICEYNKLFKNENFRIFVFDIDNLEINERFKDKFGSNNYCKLGNNVYVVRYSISQNENNDKEFFDILSEILKEKSD